MTTGGRREVPFFRPSIGEAEIAEVVETLKGGWLTTASRARRFEDALADFLGGGVEAVAVSSATAGLHLALEAAGVGPGDEVIVPDLTFTATAEVVRYLGAEARLVDVDAATLCLDAEAAARAVTPRTRAIMPVHYGGLACDMDAIGALAARHGLAIVEDAAHALPARHGGRLIGTLPTTAAVFSFYANKTITTAEGGMLVTADPEVAARARVMRLHGIDRDVFDRFTHAGGGWRYDVVAPGFKYNMPDVLAAIGIHQLARAEEFRNRRAQIASAYLDGFADLPVILPAVGGEGDHSWHLFALRLRTDAPTDRDAFIARLADEGIGCSMHYAPLHRMTYWRRRYGLAPEEFPICEDAYRSLVTLPIYPAMGDEDVGYVVGRVRAALAVAPRAQEGRA